MSKYKRDWFKFLLAIISCILIRLIPFRPPNIEPVLATQMPFSRVYGMWTGFLFAFINIAIFDAITGKLGEWTLITAFAYGFLGLWAGVYFKNKKNTDKNNKWDYVKFAILGTLAYDAVTGLSIGPLFFNQPFMEALMGQISFTLWHILGNASFAFFLSPVLYKYILKNPKFENQSISSFFNQKRA